MNNKKVATLPYKPNLGRVKPETIRVLLDLEEGKIAPKPIQKTMGGDNFSKKIPVDKYTFYTKNMKKYEVTLEQFNQILDN